MQIQGDGGTQYNTDSSVTVIDGDWHHVVLIHVSLWPSPGLFLEYLPFFLHQPDKNVLLLWKCQ